MPDLTSLKDRFRNDGVVFLKSALDEADLRMAREAYDWSLAHPSPSASDFSQNYSAKFYQDLCNPHALPAYRRLLEDSRAADIVADLWDARDVWFMYEQVFLKEGGESRRTPWHQDSSYLPVEGEKIAVMWISFDPVEKRNSLEFVRGSHRGILYNGSRFDPEDDTAPLYTDGRMPRLPNIEGERDRWDIVSWAVEPADVVVFHPAVLHGGAPTHAGGRRRTLSLRFFGDDAIYVRRSAFDNPDSTSAGGEIPDGGGTIFSVLGRTLAPGDPLRHPGFPKLRPRN
jgi:ectoine hydroxylase-related dioxygenase (phytanoyl-CoA dioxygenase family)